LALYKTLEEKIKEDEEIKFRMQKEDEEKKFRKQKEDEERKFRKQKEDEERKFRKHMEDEERQKIIRAEKLEKLKSELEIAKLQKELNEIQGKRNPLNLEETDRLLNVKII
jgi:hypothetical protein